MANFKRLDADGNLVDRSRDITLRLLMAHSAGFGYPMSSDRIKDWGNLDDQPLLFEPGTGWTYSVRTFSPFIFQVYYNTEKMSHSQALTLQVS
jgi:hypothetical protein